MAFRVMRQEIVPGERPEIKVKLYGVHGEFTVKTPYTEILRDSMALRNRITEMLFTRENGLEVVEIFDTKNLLVERYWTEEI